MLCSTNKINKELMNGQLVSNASRRSWAVWVMYTRKQTMQKGSKIVGPSSNSSGKIKTLKLLRSANVMPHDSEMSISRKNWTNRCRKNRKSDNLNCKTRLNTSKWS